MIYRVIFTLLTGFALLFGGVCLGQQETPTEVALPQNKASVEPINAQITASADTQPRNSSTSTAAAHWWQRFAPPANPSAQSTNTSATTIAPAPRSVTNQTGSTSYFGKLFKGNEKRGEQKDPFAVKAASYDEVAPKPADVVAEPVDSTKTNLTPPPAAPNPWSAPANDSLAAMPAGTCPYPDTGIQTLYQPVQAASGTMVSDRSSLPAEPPTVGKVHGAFDGLLGHDDVRTQKEAASLPLLSPYKELPLSSPQAATDVRAVKPGPSTSRNDKKVIPEADKAVSASAVARSQLYTDKLKTDSSESVVNAAFTLPSTDAKSKANNGQMFGTETGETAASNRSATPQPLQLNGVEANQLTGNPLNRPKFIYRPATSVVDNAGHKMIKPEVRVAPDSVANSPPTSVQLAQFAAATEGTLPAPANIAPETAYPIDDQQWMPQMSGLEGGECENCQDGCNGHGWLHGHNDCCRSGRIGAEYVEHAPFFIQTTQPFNNCYVRLDLARDLEFPDRSEFFWARTPGGRGPTGPGGTPLPGETSVNYQDLDFYIEKGTKRLSIGTKLPIRAVDPEIHDDVVGFADMSVTTKAVIMDGKNWQLTQILNTYLPTGSVHHGTGDGHVSLEPGVAYRWKWSDWTYFHGDLKYLFPIAADPDFAGQIFNYGFGWSHVAVETDTWALIPTLEFECWTFVDGRQTLPLAPANSVFPLGSEEINNIGIMNVCPGLRWVCDKGCDCGTKEFGISAGISVTNEHLYDQLLRLEFRWSR